MGTGLALEWALGGKPVVLPCSAPLSIENQRMIKQLPANIARVTIRKASFWQW